jgi:hypothetical protein
MGDSMYTLGIFHKNAQTLFMYKSYELILTKMGWAALWAIFGHLVTLLTMNEHRVDYNCVWQ